MSDENYTGCSRNNGCIGNSCEICVVDHGQIVNYIWEDLFDKPKIVYYQRLDDKVD